MCSFPVIWMYVLYKLIYIYVDNLLEMEFQCPFICLFCVFLHLHSACCFRAHSKHFTYILTHLVLKCSYYSHFITLGNREPKSWNAFSRITQL